MGSIAIPGAIVMVNTDLSASVQNRLQIQLHINETITGQNFDLRLAADPNYVQNVRALRQRILVMRDFRDMTNRTEMDVVIFVREAMVYIEKNCFGPTGMAFALSNIYWGQLGIFDIDTNRTCQDGSSCGCGPIDGYGRSPYYPARFDPKYPAENHWYNQVRTSHVFGNCGCSSSPDRTLCSQYYYDTKGNIVRRIGCRRVRQ